MLVVLALSAVLLRQPSLLTLLAFVVAAEVYAVAMLLRPMSLSVEGSELVYRGTRSEKRISRSEIASCQQVGQGWAFSDSAGAQLLTVQSLRFNETAISALCSQAGIAYNGPSQRPVDKALRDLSSGKGIRAWGVGLGLVFVIGTGGLIYVQFHSQQTIRQYEAAPTCTNGAPGTATCRLQTRARVTSIERRQTYAVLHMTLLNSGGDYVADLSYPNPNTDDLVEVEVWSGQVTVVNGRPTGNNPQRDPNANLNGAIGVVALFGFVCVVMAAAGQYQVTRTRAAVRVAAGAESGSARPVEKVHPDTTMHGVDLPPCGILHQPKEQLYLHEDPRNVRTAIVIASVVFAVLLAGLVALAIYVSVPIFGGLAVLLGVFYAIQLVGQLRELRFGGLYADDLHVAKITTDWLGRFERKVYDRTAVLEVKIEPGIITVLGVDGSTLFWTGFLSASDMDRYADFLGARVVREAPPVQQDAIAVPPTRTPVGVLPLNVRRAAGIMQAIGALCVGLGVFNVISLARTPAERRGGLLLLLAGLVAYGLVVWALGYMLARGRPHSREFAVFGGGGATAGFLAGCFVIAGNAMVVGLIAVVLVPFYLVAVYWVRKPSESRP
jgi:hypothetical protein